MTGAWVQSPLQRVLHPLADGTTSSLGLAADLLDNRGGKFDGKNHLYLWHGHGLTSHLGLLQITIGLAPGNAVNSDELA